MHIFAEAWGRLRWPPYLGCSQRFPGQSVAQRCVAGSVWLFIAGCSCLCVWSPQCWNASGALRIWISGSVMFLANRVESEGKGKMSRRLENFLFLHAHTWPAGSQLSCVKYMHLTIPITPTKYACTWKDPHRLQRTAPAVTEKWLCTVLHGRTSVLHAEKDDRILELTLGIGGFFVCFVLFCLVFILCRFWGTKAALCF